MYLNYTIYDLILKVMKISVLQLTLAITLGSMALARDNYAQQTLDREVTLHVKDVKLHEVLKEIEATARVKFVYSRNYLNLEHMVTVDVSKRRLGDILAELLTPYTIQFAAQDASDYIVLTELEDQSSRATLQELPLPQTSMSDLPAVVTGKVVSVGENTPLPGVNVIIKGTTTGTTTDAEGKYNISANSDDVLLFSFIGYKTLETQVGDRTEIDISLQEDITSLDEVVVIGYGTTTKRLKTGSIARVTDEDISKQPVTNPLAALEGRMAGVYVTQSMGTPGGAINVQIRGRNSIAGGNNPLYIIDGVPFTSTPMGSTYSSINNIGLGSPLATINPADIESIEVLKDADATAIYGSRGANGVVLITTKKGKSGETKVDVNFYTGVGQITRKMDLLNTQQYLAMRKEAFKNDGATMTPSNARDIILWDTTRYTDWQKVLIGGTANTTDAQASISGGTASTQFLVGGGYHKETTVFPGDFAYKKGSARFNLTHTSANQKFKTVFSTGFVMDDNVLPYQDPTINAFTTAPDSPLIYNTNGTLNWGPSNGNFANPYGMLLAKYKAKTDNLVSNLVLSYKVLPGLQLKTSLGYTSISKTEVQPNPSISINPIFASFTFPSTSFGNSSIKTWIIEPQADYQRTVGRGKISALIGSTFQQSISERVDLSATGFSNDALMENIASASTLRALNSVYTLYRYDALFGRLSFDWDGKYLLNLTARRDGSSRFGPNRQFANLGAIGAAWIFSREEFFKNVRFLSFGKLRGSLGTTGNDQIADYGYLDLWNPTTYPYQGGSGLYPVRLFNSNYSWETNRKLEAGLELGLDNDRVFLSVSYFNNRSSNQLVGYPLPATAGFSSIQSNLPAEVQNTGVEIEVSSKNIRSDNFSWTSSVNVTVPRNKLISYPNLAGSTFANSYVVGQSLSIAKNFHFTGVDPQTGLSTFEDVSGDGSLTYPNDLQAIKKVTQDFYGGLQNSLQYKNWKLDFLIQFVQQTGKNYWTSMSNVPGSRSNQATFVMNRWQKPGDITDVQKFTQDSGSPAYAAYYNPRPYGDNTISDASFIRFKNVSISYQFNQKWIEKAAMKNARIYLQAQNLFTITNYLGLDPENQSLSFLPPMRVITMGVQLTF
ncbi:SusC/RagA family TonB-linked outer membrane protein [Cytophagales bacterium WSM2-2]|nr:SusC/RagA family TonB-linked outer membrane protein [Cytophagales bacterium WSM2-2]